MSWFSSLFTNDVTPVIAVPPAAAKTFAEQALSSLDSLAVAVRHAGGNVSPHVFSMLRSLDDVLRPLIAHVAVHPVVVEKEFAIEALITDYTPTALTLFLKLPAGEQVDGGKADLLLQEQLTSLERNARQVSAGIYEDSVSALETHAIFIQTKFHD
jgi:hypothetical protein